MESTKGGRRKGAGRKPQRPELKKKQITFKLSQWMLDWLDEQPEAKVYLVEKALVEHFDLKAPEGWEYGRVIKNKKSC